MDDIKKACERVLDQQGQWKAAAQMARTLLAVLEHMEAYVIDPETRKNFEKAARNAWLEGGAA